ncbi:MAG TPA: NYN domain-containing protein [Terriglobia bacterium]|nr:NYN domain-containing protein [Terriglobia bacterium]
MQRVALFVDGANMFYAQRDNRWHIDWRLVFNFFTDNKEKASAYYFTATPPVGDAERVTKYRRFKTALQSIGYSVVDKEVRLIKSDASDVPVKMKGNLDIELVFRLLTEANTYDEVVLMGCDSDYIPIVTHLRAIGKVVTIVGRRGSTSNDLINVANKFLDLDAIRTRVERKLA